MLLHKDEAAIPAPQNKTTPYISLEDQPRLTDGAQYSLESNETEVSMIGVGTQTLPRPIETCGAQHFPTISVLASPMISDPPSTSVGDLDENIRSVSWPSSLLVVVTGVKANAGPPIGET